MTNFDLIEETLGYVSAEDETNTDVRYLVSGSKNVLIDRQRKVRTAGGYSRLGVSNNATTPVRSAVTWGTSTGVERPIRHYDDELEVYLTTVDATAINAWTRISQGWSTTEKIRFATWFDTTENIDLLAFVQGDDNIYEWNGAVAVVSSITGTTITKAGTTTFAQNRFYTTRNKTVVCVRTGTEYVYTGGESTLTLTGIADTTGIVAGDILVQKVVTATDKPAANRNNHTIFSFENQLAIGSEDDNEVFISQNDDYDDFGFSSPRVPGEGGLLTLDGPTKGFGALSSKLVVFAGTSSIFTASYEQLAVGSTLAETLRVKRLKSGVNQSAINQECIVPIGNALAYISQENALRMLEQPENIEGPQLKTLSNPIKPDFDAEDFSNAAGYWFENALYIAGASTSNLYILEFVEDADGKLRRFWQPPQVLPVGILVSIASALYGHSNAVAETYKLFDTLSGINSSDEKLPIHAKAAYAYRTYGKRALEKMFDEYFVEGEISQSTNDLLLTLMYDFGGATSMVERTIDGTDEDILFGPIPLNSLGQASLGTTPLGGAIDEITGINHYEVIFELVKEDFTKIQPIFETNGVDKYWSVLSHGPNVQLSPRKNISIKK